MDPVIIAIIAIIVLLALGAAMTTARRRGGSSPTLEKRAPAPASPELRERLDKTRRALGERLGAAFGRARLDDEFWSELEAILIGADLGVGAAASIVERARRRSPADGGAARDAVSGEMLGLLEGRDRRLDVSGSPAVVLVVGVNGSGKTTTIAKLAAALQGGGKSVVLGAADTYRAAADRQLEVWADRVGVGIVTGRPGADPASVAYDALLAARSGSVDVLIVDTAGRLQTKQNLMDELGKIARVLQRDGERVTEVLLVIDGTTGQNALSQARRFAESVGVTGIVMTKLDGTSRGGVVVAIEQELDIPVKLIGVGEGVDDLVPFDPARFVDALMGR
jgi:fused signal recognition particle receptor